MRRAVACAVGAALLAAPIAFAQDEASRYDAAAMARVVEVLDADPELLGRYAICPADVFDVDRPFYGDLAEDIEVETCEADPGYCHVACTKAGSGGGCFGLARAMQDNEPATRGRLYESLFTQSCAQGKVAGCTNRGGGIRNGGYEDDPFAAMDEGARENCLFRTFAVACDEEDAWGCAMLGQSYHYGEGVAENPDEAVRHYRRSCELSPDFAACRFAEAGIEVIEGPQDEYGVEQDL